MNPYFLPVICIPLGLLIVVLSSFYEAHIAGTMALAVLVSTAFFGNRNARYFSAGLTATLFCSLLWVISTGGQHAWYEGFDPMRYDWAARNMSAEDILDGFSNAWVSYPAVWLYNVVGQNIMAVAVLNFAIIATAVALFARRFGEEYAGPFMIAFLLTPELMYHSGMLAKEPLNFAAAVFFATPLLELHERRYSLKGLVALALALSIAVFVRLELILIFLACGAFVLILRSPKHRLLWAVVICCAIAGLFVFLREAIDEYMALSAILAETVLEEQGSIDPLKEFIRNATASSSFIDRLLVAPIKVPALLLGPLPKASFIDLLSYWNAGADRYVVFVNLFNKVTACMLIGATWVMLRRRPAIDGADRIFFTIGAVGILVAALVPPFLHLRYRIPFTPFLLLPLIRAGRTWQLLKAALFVYGATEVLSVALLIRYFL